MMAQRLGMQAASSEAKKPYQKPLSSHRIGGNQNKPVKNFKPFNSEIKVKLLEVLNIAPNEVFDWIKDRKLLNQPRKIVKDSG